MCYKFFTLFFSILFLVSFSVSYGQSSPIDAKAPFVVNPNPHVIDPVTDVPFEEVFGLNQNLFNAGPRSRGNLFTCTTARKLIEHRAYLGPSVSTQMWFCVYEGTAQVGTYNLISSIDVSPQGPGVGWYSSGAMDYDFIPGRYYGIWASFQGVTQYWSQNPVPQPYPIPCSFGELTAGAGWDWAPTSNFPPDATQTVPALAFADPVAYYQTIVTDDVIPVELMSFTYQQNANNTILHWVTASETNNLGFEVQRKSDDEFVPITFIAGHGTTSETHRYSYTDQNLQPGFYTYRLKQVDLDGSYYYYDELYVEIKRPVDFDLSQNYPNPFNPSTRITYDLTVDSRVTLSVYNLLGETVTTLVNSNVPAGEQEIIFDASDLNSGVYFYRIEAVGVDGSNFSSVKKMMLTK